jgi:hypothetical protein
MKTIEALNKFALFLDQINGVPDRHVLALFLYYWQDPAKTEIINRNKEVLVNRPFKSIIHLLLKFLEPHMSHLACEQDLIAVAFSRDATVASENKRYADLARIYTGFVSEERIVQIYMDKFNNVELVDYLRHFINLRLVRSVKQEVPLFKTLDEAIACTNEYAVFPDKLSFYSVRFGASDHKHSYAKLPQQHQKKLHLKDGNRKLCNNCRSPDHLVAQCLVPKQDASGASEPSNKKQKLNQPPRYNGRKGGVNNGRHVGAVQTIDEPLSAVASAQNKNNDLRRRVQALEMKSQS